MYIQTYHFYPTVVFQTCIYPSRYYLQNVVKLRNQIKILEVLENSKKIIEKTLQGQCERILIHFKVSKKKSLSQQPRRSIVLETKEAFLHSLVFAFNFH